jgi:hypothetical protein
VLHKQLADSKRTGRRGLGCAACKLAANNQVDQRYVPLACWRDNLLQRHNNFFAPRIDHHAASAETDPPRGLHRVGVSFECRLTATMPALSRSQRDRPTDPHALQLIATWNTPCSSRRVQPEGTSTRRHTIVLMPNNHTLTCTIAFASAADGARFSVGRGGFGRRVIQKDCCHTSRPS